MARSLCAIYLHNTLQFKTCFPSLIYLILTKASGDRQGKYQYAILLEIKAHG